MQVSGQLHVTPVLPWGKIRWYPLVTRLSEPQNLSQRDGEEKSISTITWNRTPIVQAVAYLVSWLSYP